MSTAKNPDPSQASDDGWYPRLIRVSGHIWRFSVRAALVALVLLLLIPLKSAIFDTSFVIGEFSVPDELQKTGVTSGVIGRLFFDRVAEMQRVAKSAVAERQLGSAAFGGAGDNASKIADIKLPGADISLVTLVSQIRALLRIQDTKIVGEIIASKKDDHASYLLRAHATGGYVWVESEEGSDIAAITQTIATRLVERFDPLIAGYYYLRTPREDHSNLDAAIGIAEGFHSEAKDRQVWALVLRGLAWREKQGDPNNIRASLCAAIDHDRSFTPAWRILAGSLRDDGDLARAQDLALRLIDEQPDEPEGYRQLGSVRRDCTAGQAQEDEAKRLFVKAMELGEQRGEDQPDYLSRVDYARFLYTWYSADKEYPANEYAANGYPALSKPNALSARKWDYMDKAAEYLGQAAELAPNETSIYTNWARTLGYPRTAEVTNAERESRFLQAELRGKYALNQDSTSPFANLVMGELLTDHGVVQHKYKQVDKFLKAQEFLAVSRKSTVRPESLYDAMFARALAGAGDFAAAEEVLSRLEHRGQPIYLVEWVRGEMLYNQGRLAEALGRLKRAKNVRSCGPRSNLVQDLINTINRELGNSQAEAQGEATNKAIPVVATAEPADPVHAAKILPEPAPACAGWDRLEGDKLDPWRARHPTWWPF
jgi:tetratricopeptide (TPR) repeat protein